MRNPEIGDEIEPRTVTREHVLVGTATDAARDWVVMVVEGRSFQMTEAAALKLSRAFAEAAGVCRSSNMARAARNPGGS